MAKKKNSAKKGDLKIEFKSPEFTESFILSLREFFPDAKFKKNNSSALTIWADGNLLSEIRILSERECFQREKISVYTPC